MSSEKGAARPAGPGIRTRAGTLARARQRLSAGLVYRSYGLGRRQSLLRQLGERVKELSLVHASAKLLQARRVLNSALLQEFVTLLPQGWQYPELCQARLVWNGYMYACGDWQRIRWQQSCLIQAGGRVGRLEIGYARLPKGAQAFLSEERSLLASLGELLQFCLERHLAAAELEAREAHIRLLLDSTAEAIYGIDCQGRCSFANRACARLLGFDSPSALIGREMHALMHHSRADGSPYPASECPIHACLAGGESVHSADDLFWCGDGSSWPAEYYANPILRGGMIVGAVVSVLDLTEQRRQQQLLQDQNQRLREIAWIQSHEIRRPLANLLGLIELLRQEPGNPCLIDHLAREAEALDALVQGIVRLSCRVLDAERSQTVRDQSQS